MKQILCISHTPWQSRPTRTQQLLARLSDVQVLFIEPPVAKGEPTPKQDRKIRSHITLCTLPAPLFSPPSRFFLQKNTTKKAIAFIRKAMERNRFRNPLLWCTSPDQIGILGQFPVCGVIYDCHQEWPEEYVDMESHLASQADVVFAASDGLVHRLSPCSENIALIPNGVNPLLFQRDSFSPPDDIAALAGQTVFGHIGDLTQKVDLNPLLNIATAHSDWIFLMMGNYTGQVASTLSRYPNIVLTGPITSVEIPDYLSVCTVLFDLLYADQMGCDIIPSHVFEYMATGKPIIRLAAPETFEPYPDFIYTAYDTTGFARRCKNAFSEDDAAAERRKEFAYQCSWANRTEEILRILESTGLF